METLAEFLKNEINQRIALDKIIETLRSRGEWGTHGLFSRIGKEVGLSPAYAGQVLSGKKPLTDKFIWKLADYFKVSEIYLRGGSAIDLLRDEDLSGEGRNDDRISQILTMFTVESVLDFESGKSKYPELWKVYNSIPNENKEEAFSFLKGYRDLTISAKALLVDRDDSQLKK